MKNIVLVRKSANAEDVKAILEANDIKYEHIKERQFRVDITEEQRRNLNRDHWGVLSCVRIVRVS